MKTFVFEGIATSGKSTIINKLRDSVPAGVSVKVVPESETLMKIVDNTDSEVSVHYLNALLDEVYADPYDLVIFDRLYLTHVFRTSSSVAEFSEIENRLQVFSPATVFLEVDEAAIPDRIQKAWEHRDPEWEKYVRTKGKDMHEISDYYMQQQRKQKQLLQKTAIPYKVYNTTEHNYESIVKDVFKLLDF